MQNPFIHPEGLFGVVTRLASIVSLSEISVILQKTISELTDMTASDYCSVYLVPDLLVGFGEELARDNKTIPYDSISKHCVVLAASNQGQLHQWLHKAFYFANESITGMSYEKKSTYNIKNLHDQGEVNSCANNTEDTSFLRKGIFIKNVVMKENQSPY